MPIDTQLNEKVRIMAKELKQSYIFLNNISQF